MRKSILAATMAAFSFLMSACGGGSGGASTSESDSSAAAVPSAQGAYRGTASDGRDITALVLDQGVTWILYGTSSNGGPINLLGFMNGQASYEDGGQFNTDLQDFSSINSVAPASLEALYVPGKALDGTLTYGDKSTASFKADEISIGYDYDKPADLASVKDTWTGGATLASQSVATLKVDPDGAFTLDVGGCPAQGRLTPRASGKNVFDVSLTPCQSPEAARGNAFAYSLAGTNKTQFILMVTVPGQSNGLVFLAQR